MAGAGSDDRAAFFAAYDRMLQRWPADSQVVDLESEFGTTRVRIAGPADGPPLVLLHAYQATSAEWVPLAGLLTARYRLCAVDVIGDAGCSTVGRRAVSTPGDLVEYLDTVLDGLGLPTAELGGHSFGAWIAMTYGISRPARVDRLVLLDPTMIVSPLLKGYVFRALPAMLKPTGAIRLSLIRWETRKGELDGQCMQVTGAAADAFGGMPSVPTKIPAKAVLTDVQVPTLVLVAGKSRVHQVKRVAQRALRFPQVRVEIVDGASHYGLPITHADQVAALILQDVQR